MSHFLTIVGSDNKDIYSYLEKYWTDTEEKEYIEFFDKTEELKEDYNGTVTAIRLPNGSIVTQYDRRFMRQYRLRDNKVYKKWFGKNNIDKRTKKCKKFKVLANYPLKKFYKTFDEFATEGRCEIFHAEQNAYGYYHNPNGFFESCTIGGRWGNRLLVKKEVEDVIKSNEFNFDVIEKRCTPKGYKWVSCAKKRDIEWAKMKEVAIKEAVKLYYRHKTVFQNLGSQSKGNYSKINDCLYNWDVLVYRNGESLREYITRRGILDRQFFTNCFAFVNADCEWFSRDIKARFEESFDNEDARTWSKKVEQFLQELDDDKYVTFVDCHT